MLLLYVRRIHHLAGANAAGRASLFSPHGEALHGTPAPVALDGPSTPGAGACRSEHDCRTATAPVPPYVRSRRLRACHADRRRAVNIPAPGRAARAVGTQGL